MKYTFMIYAGAVIIPATLVMVVAIIIDRLI